MSWNLWKKNKKQHSKRRHNGIPVSLEELKRSQSLIAKIVQIKHAPHFQSTFNKIDTVLELKNNNLR